MSRTIIIGDIHGCIAELKELVAILKPSSTDTLVFTGDLIDRGPDDSGVVKFLIETQSKCHLRCVLGNHDEKFFRWLDYKEKASIIVNPVKPPEDSNWERLHKELNQDELNWMRNQMEIIIHLPNVDTTIVHAGIPAHFTRHVPTDEVFNPITIKNYTWLRNTATPKQRDLYKQLLFTRRVSSSGYPITLEKQTDKDAVWADLYHGEYGRVVFGHAANPNIVDYRYATAIDTGCVYGGYLTAIILIDRNTAPYFIQTKAHKSYVTSKLQDYGN